MSTNDPDFYQAPKFAPEPPRAAPSQHGCFFYGCIIASILALLMVILISVVVYFGYRALNRYVEEYTATTPRELPKVDMPVEQRQALKDRVEAFRKAVDAGTSTEPLVLTSDDLNALIDDNPDLKGKIYVKVEGDEVKGQVSIPLDALGLGMLRGRYLNGEADLKASLQDGVLIVTLDSVEVNGQRPPEQFMTELRKQNLAKDAYKDEKTSRMIRKIESLEIKDGKVILRLRAKASDTSGSTAAKKAVPVEVIAPGESPTSKVQPRPSSAEAPTPKS